MESQQKMLLAVIIVLVAFALFIVLTTAPAAPVAPAKPADTTAAESILHKAMLFGKGQGTYSYSFSDISNGYNTTYTLVSQGGEREAIVQNPISTKEIYYLKNGTILCITYGDEQGCSMISGNADAENYLNSISADFFNDTIINTNDADATYLLDRGYIMLDPAVSKETFNGHACDAVDYIENMTNVTVEDAARFGIGATTPKIFRWSMCVDNQTGYLYDRSFNYTYNGINYTSEFQLISLVPNAPAIIPPQNLSGDAVAVLTNERTEQAYLAACITEKSGDERDKCIETEAREQDRLDICMIAGARKDECLVSLMPLLKDISICGMVTDPSYKDDCYIELAGAEKNDTYCSYITNSTNVQLCEQAAIPAPFPQMNQTLNETGTNQTGSPAMNVSNATESQVNAFMYYIDNTSGSASNATTNSTR